MDQADVYGLDNEARKEKSSIPEFNNMDAFKQKKKITEFFREVFDTPHGRIVLGIILEDLHYFTECDNEQAQALNNYAKSLISDRLGINDNKKRVDALFSAK